MRTSTALLLILVLSASVMAQPRNQTLVDILKQSITSTTTSSTTATTTTTTTTSTTTTTTGSKLPDKIVGGYICGVDSLSVDKIVASGFNFILVSFFQTSVTNGVFSITESTCCDARSAYTIAKQLLAKGITVSASIGGDGCQGAPPTGLDVLSADAIVKGFQNFITATGVAWSGLDFDWEGSS
jgi:hypothetical protein